MSAFMVSPDCIHRVVAIVIEADDTLRHGSNAPACLLPFIDRATGKIDRDLLGMRLLDLNRRALDARYPGEAHPVPAYRFVTPMRGMQNYKSLRCYLYQCAEGDVADDPLIGVLDALQEAMAATLGHRPDGTWRNAKAKAAYDAAEWG